jgi:hypothetical protein
MSKKRYKVGEKVRFYFAGCESVGVIEQIPGGKTPWYSIRDNENYLYPIAFDRILDIVK